MPSLNKKVISVLKPYCVDMVGFADLSRYESELAATGDTKPVVSLRRSRSNASTTSNANARPSGHWNRSSNRCSIFVSKSFGAIGSMPLR